MNCRIIRILNEKGKTLCKISLCVLLLLSACRPDFTMSTPPARENPPTEVLSASTIEPAIEPTSASAKEQIYPPYPPLATTKLENVSQTINGVTAQIDWAYVGEGRIAIQYTISGLE